jgi:hypothetical protein
MVEFATHVQAANPVNVRGHPTSGRGMIEPMQAIPDLVLGTSLELRKLS